MTAVSLQLRRGVAWGAMACVAVALTATARGAAAAPATSDTAVIELYTRLASEGRLLLGAYSRFQWHHPGPLYFYLLVPFYRLSGETTVGLHAGAAALALASLGTMLAVLHRRRPWLALLAAVSATVLVWRAAEALASPWNPHVALWPIVALVVLAADVLAGEPTHLPVAALLASVAAQAHVALVPVVGVLSVGPALRALAGVGTPTERVRWRRPLAFTLVVLAIVWCLPVYEQLTALPSGNMTVLWRFFAHRTAEAQPLPVAVSAWSDMVVGLVRPNLYVAHGWPFIESPIPWAEWLSLAVLASLGAGAVRAWLRRDAFAVALQALLLTALSMALWAVTRIDDRIFDHDVFWLVGLGALALPAALDGLGVMNRSLAASVGRGRAVPWIVAVCIVLTVGVALTQVRLAARQSYAPSADATAARAVAADIAAYAARVRSGRLLLRIDQDVWGIAAGAILDLHRRGARVAVEDDWLVMFAPEFRASGNEDTEVSVAAVARHARLSAAGVPTLAEHGDVFVHALQRAR